MTGAVFGGCRGGGARLGLGGLHAVHMAVGGVVV